MPHMEDYPSPPTHDSPTTSRNPFTRYPPNTALHGSLLFYTKVYRPAECNPAKTVEHGILRGPIYQTSELKLWKQAQISANPSSCIGLKLGEGYVQDAEIRIVSAGGIFIIKLKNKELYLVERGGRLVVASTSSRDEATRFMVKIEEGRMVPMTISGRRWCDNGEKGGWNTLGRGEGLWLEWVSDEEKRERCRRNLWGQWRPDVDFLWR